MDETLESLKEIVEGTPIKVEMVNDYTDNVKITTFDGHIIHKQLNNNTASLSATEILKANVRVWHKRRNRKGDIHG